MLKKCIFVMLVSTLVCVNSQNAAGGSIEPANFNSQSCSSSFSILELLKIISRERVSNSRAPREGKLFRISVERLFCHYSYTELDSLHSGYTILINDLGDIVQWRSAGGSGSLTYPCEKNRMNESKVSARIAISRKKYSDLPEYVEGTQSVLVPMKDCGYSYSEFLPSQNSKSKKVYTFTLDRNGDVYALKEGKY